MRIRRPLDDVYRYVSDPRNLAAWNSAVRSVHEPSPTGRGPTYVMERELRSGRAFNRVEIVANEAPREFAMRTLDGPTPFVYRYRFSVDNGETVVRLVADVELSLTGLRAKLARGAVKRGVDQNFASLKRILESTAHE